MTLEEFDTWYTARYKRTSSALTAASMVLADFIGVMISIGLGFFIVKIFYIANDNWGGINFKSFVTYWMYLPIFVLILLINFILFLSFSYNKCCRDAHCASLRDYIVAHLIRIHYNYCVIAATAVF